MYCEDFTVTLVSNSDFGKSVSQVEIVADWWRLLEALCKRLNEIQEHSASPIVYDLVCKGRTEILHGQEIVRGQREAVEQALSQPITFIWGPPGTGKTETLSRIALAHIKQGRRVLMLSYSNVSVDGAAWRVLKNDDGKEPGKIVRNGYAKSQQLVEHPYLMVTKFVLNTHPDLAKEQNDVSAQLRRFSTEQRNII